MVLLRGGVMGGELAVSCDTSEIGMRGGGATGLVVGVTFFCCPSFCPSLADWSSFSASSVLYSVGLELERGSEGGGVGGVVTTGAVLQLALPLDRTPLLSTGNSFTGDCVCVCVCVCV